jgi:hypothetical protein
MTFFSGLRPTFEQRRIVDYSAAISRSSCERQGEVPERDAGISGIAEN